MARKTKTPIRATAEASAKLEGKASYSRKKVHKVTETIPEDVTRDKAAAWLDVFSPAREWLGLKGDIFRGKREALAVQRQQTLFEIARRFIAARPEGEPVEALPPKFLVPYIEQATLEVPNSPLVELWANLLVSAAESYDPTYLHFSKLMSSLSASQAQLFQGMFRAETLHELQLGMDDVDTLFGVAHFSKSFTHQLEKAAPKSDEEFANFVIHHFNSYAVQARHVAFEGKEYYDINFPYDTANDEDEVDLAILESLGLIRQVSTHFVDYSVEFTTWEMSVTYYHMTQLGLAFTRACKVLPSGEPPEIPPKT